MTVETDIKILGRTVFDEHNQGKEAGLDWDKLVPDVLFFVPTFGQFVVHVWMHSQSSIFKFFWTDQLF